MRLTKDNYELMMFDLLEGNIPEGEQEHLYAQILNNEFFNKEWELFKATVVRADLNSSFGGKDALLKKETAVLLMPRRIAVAVAASLLIGLMFVLPWNKVETELAAELPITEMNKEEEAGLLPESESSIASPNNLVQQSSPRPVVLAVPRQEIPTESHEEESMATAYSPQDIIAGLSSKTKGSDFSTQINLGPSRSSSIENQILVEGVVTSDQLQRITGKATLVMHKLSQPKIRFKPDWEKRQFDLEVETYGYHAMASVSPFKK